MYQINRIVLFSLCTMFMPMVGHASSPAYRWEEEDLLGYNELHYYVLHRQKTFELSAMGLSPSRDSVFLLQKELSTGKVVDKILLKVIENRYDRDGRSVSEYKYVNPMNLTSYEKKHRILPCSRKPSYDEEFTCLRVTAEGVVVENAAGAQKQVIGAWRLGQCVAWYKALWAERKSDFGKVFEVNVVEYQTDLEHDYIFVSIEVDVEGVYDGAFYHAIVAISTETLGDAMEYIE